MHERVKVIAIFVSKKTKPYIFDVVENFIYDQTILLKLHKQYLKHLKPDEFKTKKLLINEKDKKRNMSPSRIAAKKDYDKKRSQLPARIEANKKYFNKKNKSPTRIAHDRKRNPNRK